MHAGYGAHQQIVTIGSSHLLILSVVLLLGAILYVGWQATIAINLLNNFKSNQFADLKGDVAALHHDVENIKADARAERQVKQLAEQLKEKAHGR